MNYFTPLKVWNTVLLISVSIKTSCYMSVWHYYFQPIGMKNCRYKQINRFFSSGCFNTHQSFSNGGANPVCLSVNCLMGGHVIAYLMLIWKRNSIWLRLGERCRWLGSRLCGLAVHFSHLLSAIKVPNW